MGLPILGAAVFLLVMFLLCSTVVWFIWYRDRGSAALAHKRKGPPGWLLIYAPQTCDSMLPALTQWMAIYARSEFWAKRNVRYICIGCRALSLTQSWPYTIQFVVVRMIHSHGPHIILKPVSACAESQWLHVAARTLSSVTFITRSFCSTLLWKGHIAWHIWIA